MATDNTVLIQFPSGSDLMSSLQFGSKHKFCLNQGARNDPNCDTKLCTRVN